MSNNAVVRFGTTQTLVASGAALANNTMSAASAAYDLRTAGGGFPDGDLVATLTFAVAPTLNSTVDVFARELDIDGTLDAQVPTTTFRQRYVGSFVVNNVATAQTLLLRANDLPTHAEYHLHNNATGQQISAGWTLRLTPRTLGPAV